MDDQEVAEPPNAVALPRRRGGVDDLLRVPGRDVLACHGADDRGGEPLAQPALGMRVLNAIVRVRRGDDGRVVKDPKSEAGKRPVNIPPYLMPAVKDHLAGHVAASRDALVFPAASGAHMAPSALYAVYHPAREAAGRPDLRFMTSGTPGPCSPPLPAPRWLS
jgi:hypothetical protein